MKREEIHMKRRKKMCAADKLRALVVETKNILDHQLPDPEDSVSPASPIWRFHATITCLRAT